jgi:hypothetical protein
MAFDAGRTKMIIALLVSHPSTGKLFIEPHLRQRLNLKKYQNIRFHGCRLSVTTIIFMCSCKMPINTIKKRPIIFISENYFKAYIQAFEWFIYF